MTSGSARVLVLGGTGKTGSRVAAALHRRGVDPAVASRRGQVRFDWADRSTWEPALHGVDAVYVVDSQGPHAPDEVRDFADLAGARRLVLLSSRTYGEMGGDRLATERAVTESGARWTILRPTWFAQNFTEFEPLASPLNDAGPVSAPADLGRGRRPSTVMGMTGYIEVAGLRMWHEVSGEGDPLVLLHGGFVGASSFFAQVPALVEAGYRVHVPERRGHAHTPDVEGPLSYSVMADDMIAYLDQEVGAPAHLVGWSDGAVVALLVARQRPDLAARMVLIGQYYNSSGRVAGGDLVAYLNSPEAVTFLRRGYDPVSPDGPDHFSVVHAKMMHMFATEPEIALDTLAGVTAPSLVLQGDRDEVTVEHSLAVVAALPEARLAVLPGTHTLPLEYPELVNALILSFLRGTDPAPDWNAFTG